MHNLIEMCYLGNGQLRKKVLEAGSGPDSKPQRGQNVTINLRTALSDGTAVSEENDLIFTLGDGDVIQVTASGVRTHVGTHLSLVCLLHKLGSAFTTHTYTLISAC